MMKKLREEERSPRPWLATFIQVGFILPNPLSDCQCQCIQSNFALPSKAKASIAISSAR